jgi:hypothetical protein
MADVISANDALARNLWCAAGRVWRLHAEQTRLGGSSSESIRAWRVLFAPGIDSAYPAKAVRPSELSSRWSGIGTKIRGTCLGRIQRQCRDWWNR